MIKKGIIMDIRDKKAIVMNNKGAYDEINATSSMRVGNEIEYGDNSTSKIVATMCMIFVMIGSVFGFNQLSQSQSPISYVAVDINPGVEFTLNAKDEIISVSATNKDGELLLAGLDYKGEAIDVAVNDFVNEAYKLGYIDENKADNAVMITVVNDEEEMAIKLQNTLYASVNQYFNDNQILGVVLGEETNEVLRLEAQSEGLSAGKLRLIKQAVKADPNLSKEEAASMPVKDLNKVIESQDTTQTMSNQESLLEEKELTMMNVSMFRMRSVETDENEVPFKEKLDEYQNQTLDKDLSSKWEEVNKNLDDKKPATQDPQIPSVKEEEKKPNVKKAEEQPAEVTYGLNDPVIAEKGIREEINKNEENLESTPKTSE